MRLCLSVSVALAIAWCGEASFAAEMTFPVQSNLRAAAMKLDITPKVVEGMYAAGHHRQVSGVRDPLRAGVLVLDDGKTQAAIITLDTLGAWEELVRRTRAAIADLTDIPPEHVMITAAHNHSGPAYEPDSEWGLKLVNQLADAAAQLVGQLKPVTIGYAEDRISFNINRRKVIDGRAVVRMNPDGLCDHRVKVLRFDDGQSLTPVAVLMHAVCHPCFFTWGDQGSQPYPNGFPLLSADFPGEAQTFVEMVYGGKTNVMFLQGCAGDIRPNLPGYPYRCADEADIQWAGRDLGGATVRALARSLVREELSQRETYYPIRVASKVVMLPGKDGEVRSELMAMKVGPYLFLSMPGEPMVEYGFKLEQAIADRAIPVIVGYANGNIGYIATADAYEVGGYEPSRSVLAPDAELVILEELGRLTDQVVGDVFESFSKHPKDVKKREQDALKK